MLKIVIKKKSLLNNYILKQSNLHILNAIAFKLFTKIDFRLSGSLSTENLRERIKVAFTSKDKKLLDATIKESVSAGLPGLSADIQEAREALYKLEGGRGG